MKVAVVSLQILSAIFVHCGSVPIRDNGTTLILTSVLFRHGDRTPDKACVYPNDPYINETYYPFGHGQLTNQGKRTEYNIGKALRRRYGKFLGEIYTPEILDARSTDVNRTKMSLELVLAGLFPPVHPEIWSSLPWQPIPYNYWRVDEDEVLFGVGGRRFRELYGQYQNSTKEQSGLKTYKDVFEYLTEKTGRDIKTNRDAFELFFCLATEEEWGLKLPKWTKKVWPKILKDLAIREYSVQTATTGLRTYTSGYLLRKIIEDARAKIDGKSPGRKLYLYSAHEMNVAQLLIVLGVFTPHVPPYGAYVVLELHETGGQHAIKILYQDYEKSEPTPVQLPACEMLCPLEQFVSLYEEYLPTN